MEEKILTTLLKYAKRDRIPNLSIAFFDLEKQTTVKQNFENPEFLEYQKTQDYSLYEIGSITKVFTALCFGILNSQGVLNINNSVKEYFKYPISPIFDSITIADIITHKSGLPRLPSTFISKITTSSNPYTLFSKTDLYDYLQSPTDFSTRKIYKYSNLGYGILGNILEGIFDKGYGEVVESILLEPLNMERTKTLSSIKKESDLLLKGYNRTGKVTEYWENNALAGAGSFFSCSDDMLVFLMSHFQNLGNVEFSLDSLTNTMLSSNISYGWHLKNSIISKLLGYSGYYWHNGMTGGFSSFICLNKKKRNGMIILANKAIPLESYFYRFTSYFA